MKKIYKLEGLGCANCAAKIEKEIRNLDGVHNVTVNFMTTKLVIEVDDDKIENVIETAKKIIKKIEPDTILKKV